MTIAWKRPGSRLMSSLQPDPRIVDAQRQVELEQIQEALRGLKFGAVSIIVQDGVVVQIDRTEKRRLRRAAPESEAKG
jgi:hypothetical protein